MNNEQIVMQLLSQLTEKDNLICELTQRINTLMQNIQIMDQRIASLVNAQFGTKSEKLKKTLPLPPKIMLCPD